MSAIAIGMNLLLAGLLLAALVMGWRLNGRLKTLRDSHDGFAKAVSELDAAAMRAEQGLADLRAATDEATDALADRIEKARALATKLERLTHGAPAAIHAQHEPEPEARETLGALLAAARETRPPRSDSDRAMRRHSLSTPQPPIPEAAADIVPSDRQAFVARVRQAEADRRSAPPRGGVASIARANAPTPVRRIEDDLFDDPADKAEFRAIRGGRR